MEPPPVLFEQTADGFSASSGEFQVHLTKGVVSYRSDSVSVEMRLDGATRVAPVAAAAPVTVNRFIGSPSQWRRNIPASTRVLYSAVYPGIDLAFYSHGKRLEYDFVLAPHADPSAIRLEWSGARKLALTRNGGLEIATASGSLEWLAPNVYQEIDGVRKPVRGEFALLGANRVGFRVPSYDPSAKLVIDPAIVFSTYLGGSKYQGAHGVAADASGDVYVAGGTDSIDLPVTRGAYQTGYQGGTSALVKGDAFIAKYSSAGALVFLTYLGGTGDDTALGIALDATGNAYVTGSTNSANFPVTSGAFQTTFGGYMDRSFTFPQGDAFVAKLSADGSTLQYATYVGGNDDDIATAIAVDSAGNAYITGTTQSRNFPVTAGAYRTRYSGEGGQEVFPCCGFAFLGGDAFATKLNPTGTALVYSTLLGGSYDDVATTLALDTNGAVVIGGYTLSQDFPLTQGAFDTSFGGVEGQNYFFNFGDGFVTRLDPTGSSLVFSTLIGGSGDDWVSSVLIDPSGNVYAAGGTTSTNFPVTSGAFQPRYKGPAVLPFFVDQLLGDGFLVELNPTGASLALGTYVGGSGDDNVVSMAFDTTGNIVLAGFTNSSDFPVVSTLQNFAGPGPSDQLSTLGDAFVAQFSPAGKELFGTFLGGAANDIAGQVTVTSAGTALVVGSSASTDFPVSNAAQPKYSAPASPSIGDAFVTALSGFGGGPHISSVKTAASEVAAIAANTWIEIKGSNLAATTRPWSGSDFVNGMMPTQLNGVSATVDGKPAFVYYISSGQINVLTPIDSAVGNVLVQVKTQQGTSNSFSVPTQSLVPSFFQFGAGPYAAATHADGSYLGPASLYPGLTTPAAPGETVVLYGNGFGAVNPAVVNGSAIQSGTLPVTPTITIGGINAKVIFAGVTAPGLYQFNVDVPDGVPNGDAAVTATLSGQSTQSGVLLTIQK